MKTDKINAVSQFFTISSPNEIPLTIIKNNEMEQKTNERLYPIILNHQGNLKADFFLFFFSKCLFMINI